MTQGYIQWKSAVPQSADIPHYYGDVVRVIFLIVAVLSFVSMPLWGVLLPFVGKTLQILAPLLLVLLAGLTSARSPMLMIANATIAGMSVILLEYAALQYEGQGASATQIFIVREILAVLMLVALYFSIKTARAMLSGKIGKADSPLEFFDSEASIPQIIPERKSMRERTHLDVSDYDE